MIGIGPQNTIFEATVSAFSTASAIDPAHRRLQPTASDTEDEVTPGFSELLGPTFITDVKAVSGGCRLRHPSLKGESRPLAIASAIRLAADKTASSTPARHGRDRQYKRIQTDPRSEGGELACLRTVALKPIWRPAETDDAEHFTFGSSQSQAAIHCRAIWRSLGDGTENYKNTSKTGTNQLDCFMVATTFCYHHQADTDVLPREHLTS
jgi:hypothetical protein